MPRGDATPAGGQGTGPAGMGSMTGREPVITLIF
jgi:hypothetical protein